MCLYVHKAFRVPSIVCRSMKGVADKWREFYFNVVTLWSMFAFDVYCNQWCLVCCVQGLDPLLKGVVSLLVSS